MKRSEWTVAANGRRVRSSSRTSPSLGVRRQGTRIERRGGPIAIRIGALPPLSVRAGLICPICDRDGLRRSCSLPREWYVLAWQEADNDRSCSRMPVCVADFETDRNPSDWSDSIPETQNIPLSCSALSGITCSTSQCSTTLPSLSNRKMSMPA